MEWRQGEPSLRHAGRSSLTPSLIPCPLGHVGARPALCVCQGVLLIVRAWHTVGLGSTYGRSGAGLTGTPVVLGGVLGAHGSIRGTALTRRVPEREVSTCPSLGDR